MGRSLRPGARTAALATVVALPFAVGCGAEAPPPSACMQATGADVMRALDGAPDHAALADGTLLSECVDRAESDAQLQTLGLTFVAVSDQLAAQVGRDRDAAFRLGFLVGAAERGAGPTGGTQGELVQRLQQAIAFQAERARDRADVLRGIAAGRRAG
ncbi:hypothetical protein [Conexibacter arvalis]|uniref:Secreted protein n=1 Tax=Conexibacter arvalis TaxID=912552 RepID=A0A840IB40_9ACTN|nr:hypothetical protein [Conexibacter arvalis]MBB4661150.1 hypothetical protein [Conexibacter arvalis]